jgi:allophanate hydrolase subunit 1
VELAVPRLDTPRRRVAAGSVGVAGEFTGVYPTASPGGWRLLGRTSLVLWEDGAAEPATLSPGTRVRFTAVQP